MNTPPKTVTLGDIAALLGLPSPATAATAITGVNSLTDALATEISFITSDKYLKELVATRAVAVVTPRKVNVPADKCQTVILTVDDVDLAMVKVLGLFAPPIPRPAVGIDPSARIAPGTTLPEDARIGAFVSIGANVRIGVRCVIHPGVVIGDDVTLGNDCELHANVVIRERVTIGSRVIINAGSVLGTDGFGYRWDGKQHVKVPQIGTIIIEDDVELGSCVCIDRAKFGATVIGRGSKIDNLVQIAHNVKTGPFCILAGQTGVAGSTTLGTGVVLGGATSVSDHVHIADGVMAAGRSAIHESIPPKTIVSGMPALPHRQSLREQAALRKLPEIVVQMRKAQEQLDAIMTKAREMGWSEDGAE